MELSIKILTGVFICVALLMMLVILMQRPKSEGLGAAFGGGVTENIFGAQTTNVLTKITGWLAGNEDHFDLMAACDCLIYFGDLRQVVIPAAKKLTRDRVLAFTV